MSRTRTRLAQALRDRFAELRASDPALLDHHVDARSHRRGVTVAWVGGPLEATVRAVVADVSGDVDPSGTVVVAYARTPLWGCGGVHTGAGDAFLAHEGAHLLTTVEVPGCCEHCRDVEQVVDRDEFAAYVDAGGDVQSACQPAPTATHCLGCGGDGTVTAAGDRFVLSRCDGCDGRGSFDLADDAQHATAVAQAARLLEDAGPDSGVRARRLP